jgi:hypothetical protein
MSRSLAPIVEGQHVYSEFEIVPGFEFGPGSFDEAHILIAGAFNHREIFEDNHTARYCVDGLKAPDRAVWQPGVDMKGSGVISEIVKLGVTLHRERDLLTTPGATRAFWGDIVNYGGVISEEETDDRAYPDALPHIDFVAPEWHCSTLFTSSRGGTVGWRGGRGFIFKTNTERSYIDQVANSGMEPVRAERGQCLFSPDARLFMHNRDPNTINVPNKPDTEDRVLVRLFLGYEQVLADL